MKKTSVEEYLTKVLSDYGCKGIRVYNGELFCQCPFHFNKHNFKTFSVSVKEVNHKGNIGYFFYCFSCGKSGSVAKLLAHIFRCSIEKAVRLFRKHALVSVVTVDSLERELADIFESTRKARLVEAELPPMSVNQEPMMNYLQRRNRTYHGLLDIEYIASKYELYYCMAGRMAGRIIMPIRDMSGLIVGYNDRTVDDTAKRKSLHPEEQYGRILHGLYQNAPKKNCVITEGSFDMFAVDCSLRKDKQMNKEFGVVNLMGVALTPERLALIIKNYEHIYLLFDNDSAGIRMSKRILNSLKDDIAIRYCTESYPKGKDPGKCTADEILYALNHPVTVKRKTYLEWMIDKYGLKL